MFTSIEKVVGTWEALIRVGEGHPAEGLSGIMPGIASAPRLEHTLVCFPQYLTQRAGNQQVWLI